MRKRINVTIGDDTWEFLRKVPTAERSRAINNALRDWAARHQRTDATCELTSLRTKLHEISTDEVARWIREEREYNP